MENINAIDIKGSKYYITESNNMAKVWTHIFTADEVGKQYQAGEVEGSIIEVDTGTAPSNISITQTSDSELLSLAADADGRYHLTNNLTLTETGYEFNDYVAKYTVPVEDGEKKKAYTSIFKSDFYGKDIVPFSEMNIKRGLIRISYNGMEYGSGKAYTKPASTIYLCGKKEVNGSTFYYPMLPIKIPQYIVDKPYISSMLFYFELDEKASVWNTETSAFGNYAYNGIGTGYRYVETQRNAYIGSPFTNYYTQFKNMEEYSYNVSQIPINLIYTQNGSLPAIGTIIEMWADVSCDYTVTPYNVN